MDNNGSSNLPVIPKAWHGSVGEQEDANCDDSSAARQICQAQRITPKHPRLGTSQRDRVL